MASLTEFLIELTGSPELREAYQDPARRQQLLQDRSLSDNAALQPGASLAQMKQAVANEAPGGEASIEWWILVDQAPIANDSSAGGVGLDPN